MTAIPTIIRTRTSPQFNYGFDVTDPASWVYSSSTALGDASLIRLRPNKTLNTYETFRVDFDYEINDTFSLRFGGSTKEFGFDVQEWRRATEALPASVLAQLALEGVTIADYATTVSGFGSGMDLPAGTPTAWVVPDLNALKDLIDFDCNCVNSYGDFRLAAFPGETRSAYERSNGVFAQLDWNTELAGMPFRGNVGVRYVETQLTSTGILSGNPITVEHSYEDTLPSLNMVLEPVDNLLIRFAAAEVMARPSLDSLTPGGSVDASPPGLSLNTGNPFLDPIRSQNLDLSIEYYPYDEALFSIAFFSKEIDTFVQRLRRDMTFAETGFPLDLLPGGVDPNVDIFQVTSWVNTPGGDLTGYEITFQTPFSFLPAPFNDFGGVFNYTSIESEFEYITNPTTGATVVESLVGQSPTSYSATLYYERGPFEARVSGTYRDQYLTLVPAQSGNDVEGKAEQMNVDFSASYDVNERLTFSFEALNLTDQYDERWISTERQNNLNYEHTGREFVVGFRYNY